jgi:hypothetical protein
MPTFKAWMQRQNQSWMPVETGFFYDTLQYQSLESREMGQGGNYMLVLRK